MKAAIIKVLISILILLSIVACNKIAQRQSLGRASFSKIIPESTIKNGTEVKDIPPWIVALYVSLENTSPNCTGEVVSSTYILTAAHCVYDHKLPYVGYTGILPIRKVEAKAIILYSGLADVALIELSAAYPGPIKPMDFYHSYYFDSYNKYQAKTKLQAMGYGMLGDEIANTNSLLNSLYTLVKYYRTYPAAMLLVSTIDGVTQGGDSGGPLISHLSFNSEHYNKILATLTAGRGSGPQSEYTVLTTDILQWIALKTKRVIIKYPLENTYTKVESQIINISGWGDFLTINSAVVYDANSDTPIAKCASKDFTLPDNETWHCQAKIRKGYKFAPYNKYQIKVISVSGKVLDSVIFHITDANIDLAITHPDPEIDDMVYHPSKDATYLIAGKGTPGAKLTFRLTQTNNEPITNDNPCSNKEAEDAIPLNGIWECRIKSVGDGAYYFLVKYANESVSFVDEGDKIYQTVASVFYTIKANSFTPFITIESPLNGAYISKNYYNIKLKFSKTNDVKEIIFYFNQNGYYVGTAYSGRLAGAQTSFSLDHNIGIVEPSKMLLTAYMYNEDNDDEPIASAVSSYSIIKPIIKITSVINNMKLPLGSSSDISGVAYYQGYDFKVPIESAEVMASISDFHNKIIDFGCNESVLVVGGFWSCPEAVTFKLPMIYLVSADLYNIGDGVDMLASDDVVISIMSPVKFTAPPK